MEYNYKKHTGVPLLPSRMGSAVRSNVVSRQSTRLSATSGTSKGASMTPKQLSASSIKKPDKKPQQQVEELYKMSFPCHTNDCCYCAYTKCLGPVKIFITQYSRSKRNQTPALAKKEYNLRGGESRMKNSMGKQIHKSESMKSPPDTRTATKPKKSISWK